MFQLLTGIQFSYNATMMIYFFLNSYLIFLQDIVELMYGGEVELKESNIKTILKFSTLFQIQEMYNLCLDWVIQHISTLNLFTLIEFGLLIQRIGEGNNDVLEIYSKTKTFGRSWPLLIVDTYITNKGCDIWGIDRLQRTDKLNKRSPACDVIW